MFEQYISDWLTSYLGHFLDIKRENLRANILSGKICIYAWQIMSSAVDPAGTLAVFSEPAGLTLTNVKLKTEALDFFQLPVAVEEAIVGSLHVRVSLDSTDRVCMRMHGSNKGVSCSVPGVSEDVTLLSYQMFMYVSCLAPTRSGRRVLQSVGHMLPKGHSLVLLRRSGTSQEQIQPRRAVMAGHF